VVRTRAGHWPRLLARRRAGREWKDPTAAPEPQKDRIQYQFQGRDMTKAKKAK